MNAYVNGTRLRQIVAGVAATIGTMTFHPAVAQVMGQPTLPAEPCQIAPLEIWTPQEKWVWRKVCVGEIADFNKEEGYGGDLDPNEPQGWPESRVLTSRFLKTILLHEPFRSAQTTQGVRIRGAWFKEPIDLEGEEIERKLWLDESRLDNGATLDDARTEVLSLRGSVVGGLLSMARAETGALFMGGANFQDVNLIGATIGGQLDMSGSTFTGTLDMDSATVEGDLFMDNGANFQDVDLRSAKIAGQLSMNSSTFATTLNMNSTTVVEDLFMREGAKFQDVDLIAAEIGKVIDMRGSTFGGTLDMRSATVGGHLLLIEADLTEAPLLGRWLSVGGNLDLRSAKVNTINLRGATVVGELWLFVSDWKPGSILDLRDAKAGRLVARVGKSSPESTMLAGFIYDALGLTASRTEESDPVAEAADFVERWLGNEAVHSRQAHEQFAAVLRQMDFPKRATQTLYEGKSHEMGEELRRGNLLQAGWLFLLWAVIGYGYRVWFAFVWIAALVAAGWLIARKSGCKLPGSGEPLGFWYSIERLLPIVELNKRHYEVDLPPRSRVYFYIHTVMGFLLATILLAELSGVVG